MANSTSDIIRGMAAGETSADVLMGDSSSAGSDVSYEDNSVWAEDSTSGDVLPGSENAPTDSSETDAGQAKPESEAARKTSGDKEVITISDDKGRRKVEIDFSNREKVKQAYQMAYGARKWQAERDQAIARSTDFEKQLTDMRGNWDALEKAYQGSGVEGVIDLLEGQQGAYRAHMQRAIEKHNFLRTASKEEIEQLELRESSDRAAKELERIRRENDDFRKQMTEKEETAQQAAMEGKVTPAFEKYRFHGKLGDEVHEGKLDKMLWLAALESLEPYEERGLDITQSMIEKAFRDEARTLRAMIGKQAEKKVSKVIEQKKQEATENVQAKVMSGYKKGGDAQEAKDLIENGNLKGLFQQWGKFGKVFNK